MAPRRARHKVGLRRMDAALDAMRPMGFPSDVVCKCVKKLLKVYGEDGWVFIEDSAYKLLIDSILEEPPEAPQLELVPGPLLLEGCSSGGNYDCAEPVVQLCDQEVIDHEQASELDIPEPEKHDDDVSIKRIKKQEQKLDVKVSPSPFQVAEQLDSLPANTTPQPANSILINQRCKPCYGWISDDEDEDEESDFLHLIPANRTFSS